MPNYWVQTEHEEVTTGRNQFSMSYVGDSSSSRIHVGDWDMGNVNQEGNLNHYQEMIFDAATLEFGMCS